MVELDQFKYTLSTYVPMLKELGASLNLDAKKERIAELSRYMEAPDFWDDPERSQKMTKELKSLEDTVKSYTTLSTQYDDISELIEMGYEENDPEVIPVIQESLDEFTTNLEALRLSTLLNGENAYGYLKSEKGVHRLVRISPFNAAGKRQTSFVSCDVMPEIEEDLDVEINDDDLRIDTYRSSGAGGQHINKTSSAIRITHLPTGIVVTCQNERSQFQNKDKAMQMLKAKLYMLKQQENEEKISGIRGEVKDIAWGNQIRSYVLQPYTMVKDHRTGASSGNASAVLDGDIDLFISAYLRWLSTGEKVSEDTGE